MTHLHDLLEVDPESPSGLRWKSRKQAKAGWIEPHGYWKVTVNYKRHYCHALVLELSGQPRPFPQAVADHIDCDKSNNRIENLRWITRSHNNIRVSTPRVYKANDSKSWVARVRVGGIKYQKRCKTREAALVEALALRLQHFWKP